MPINNSHDALVARRQEIVAQCLLEGLTQRQIVVVVNKEFDKLNQEFGLTTINADVKKVKAAWRKASVGKVDRYIAEQHARTQEIITSLWPNRANPRTAEVLLAALKRQSELLGLDKPLKTENDTALTIRVLYEDRENQLDAGK